MAKSLKDTLKLGPRVEFKKTEKNIEATEKAVAQIHEEAPVADKTTISVPEKIQEQAAERVVLATETPAVEITKRVTLDIPLYLHAEIKMKTFRKGITIKEYLLALAKIDLNL